MHILAQPNLTAVSGEAASFLVGGEFPIPVAQQNNQVTIEFKQFGVSLAFVPTVASDGQITLKVRPEVSQLSNQNAFQLTAGNSVLVVPSLIVRRAETTVQLGSGESFAIAGLLQDSANVAGSGLPIMGDVPILGALFRSDKFQRNETELVIVVTPYIVRPVANPRRCACPPTDGSRPPTSSGSCCCARAHGTPAARRRRARRRRTSPAMPDSSCNDGVARYVETVNCSASPPWCWSVATRLDPYRREGTWRPNGANEANLRAMVVSPSDLVRGVWSVGRQWPAGRGGPGSLQERQAAAAARQRSWQRSYRSPSADRKAASNAARRTASRNSRRSRHPPAPTGRTSSPSSRMPKPRACCATD